MIDDARIDAILNAGVATTTLPSGLQVRGTLPDEVDIIRRGLVPPDLRVALLAEAKREAGIVDDEAVEAAGTGLFWLEVKAAAFIEDVRLADDEPWQARTVSIEQFRRMSPADRAHLRDLVQRRSEVAELEPFRDGRPGADGGEDGRALADEAERAPADPGRPGGVRPRRGAGAAAGARGS